MRRSTCEHVTARVGSLTAADIDQARGRGADRLTPAARIPDARCSQPRHYSGTWVVDAQAQLSSSFHGSCAEARDAAGIVRSCGSEVEDALGVLAADLAPVVV